MTDPNSTIIAKKDIDRFLSYILIQENTDAWLWKGGISSSGYGAFWYNGSTVGAHRFSFMAFVGPIQQGFLVCHKYENLGRHNVNPEHLFLGTYKDNMEDAAVKQRTLSGGSNPQSVLSDQQVLEIVQSQEKYNSLANSYGVSENIVSKIKRGELWTCVTGLSPTTKRNLANKSGYTGVRFKKGGWESSIGWRRNGQYKSKYLGRYKTPVEAARAYDVAAKEIHGNSAVLNFPSFG